MSATGLPVFDTTIQKTNLWLHEISEELGWDSRHKSYQALRAVLQTLRDHLPVDEAVQLGSQLPMLVRGFYFEGWRPHGKPDKDHSAESFLEHVAEHFPNDPEVDTEAIVRSVFRVMADHIPGGEIEGLINVLPKTLRHFWQEYHFQP
jgi:uncharacterized protein (DUF2267 family)